jgi:hypothetical protein
VPVTVADGEVTVQHLRGTGLFSTVWPH